jgi:WD40 repeat protein
MDKITKFLKGKFQVSSSRVFAITLNRFQVYDSQTGEVTSFKDKNKNFTTDHYLEITLLPLSSNQLIASDSYKAGAFLINLDTNEVKVFAQGKGSHHNQYVAGVVLSESPPLVALLNRYGILYLWNYEKDKLVNQFRLHQAPGEDEFPEVKLVYQKENDTLIYFNGSTIVIGFDTKSFTKKKPLELFWHRFMFRNEDVLAIPNSKDILTLNSTNIAVWSFNKGQGLILHESSYSSSHSSSYSSYAFLSDGRLIVSVVKKEDENEAFIKIYRIGEDFELLKEIPISGDKNVKMILELSSEEVLLTFNDSSDALQLNLVTGVAEEVDFKNLVINAITLKKDPDQNKIMKCILVVKLKENLPRDLINETYSFL